MIESVSEDVPSKQVEKQTIQIVHVPAPMNYRGGSGEESSKLSVPTLLALGAGAAAGLAANTATHFYLNSQLIPFDAKVAELTRNDIMNRSGAGLANMGVGMDAGMGSHVIQDAHSLNLIRSGEYPLAEMMYKFGGRGGVSLAAGLVAGVSAFALVSSMYASKDSRDNDKSWSKRVDEQDRQVSQR